MDLAGGLSLDQSVTLLALFTCMRTWFKASNTKSTTDASPQDLRDEL
jgi:hypothetical protein